MVSFIGVLTTDKLFELACSLYLSKEEYLATLELLAVLYDCLRHRILSCELGRCHAIACKTASAEMYFHRSLTTFNECNPFHVATNSIRFSFCVHTLFYFLNVRYQQKRGGRCDPSVPVLFNFSLQ